MSMICASTLLKLFSISGVELPQQEEVSLDAELILKELDRRLGIIPNFNFSITVSLRDRRLRSKRLFEYTLTRVLRLKKTSIYHVITLSFKTR